ncbi:MAG: hypothetical protein AB7M12_00740 [Hyphomonadaceae bacterium]
MGVLSIFPLLSLPALIYAILAAPSGTNAAAWLATKALSFKMAGGAEWLLTRGHLITIFAVFCLFLEILKSTRATTLGMIDTALSVGVFIVCLVLFLLVPGFATTEFFLVMLMAILDFLAGSTVMVFAARRTIGVEERH